MARENISWHAPDAPAGWQLLERTNDGAKYVRILTSQTVIVSRAIEEDGRLWTHFSTAHGSRLPRWNELVEAKEAFLGAAAKAIQIIPPRDHYVNINPHVLHLFVCEDGNPLPEFSGVVNGVRTL